MNTKIKLWSDILLVIFLIFALIERSTNTLIIFSVLGIVPVAVSTIKAIFKKTLTIDLLASIALLFSLITREWTSLAFINLMLAFARIFDNWTESKTKKIIEKLLKYRPDKIHIKKGKDIVEIPVEKVQVGDLVVIDSGQRIPIDGTIIEGFASIDQATLTGESDSISKKEGDKVLSSTLVLTGSIIVRAEKIGKDSTLFKIIALVDEASRKKSPTEKIAQKITGWYILGTILISVLIFLITKNTSIVLAVLLVVCADDLAVAIPLTFSVAIAKSASLGILVKGSDVLEKLTKIKIFLTDKTGTLTLGKPKISRIEIFTKMSQKEFLKIAAIAASGSGHPVTKAIVDFSKKENPDVLMAQNYEEFPGSGIKATMPKKNILLGKPGFLEINKIELSKTQKETVVKYRDNGYGITMLALNNKVIGFFATEDSVKNEAKNVISKTLGMGVKKWVILSGDNEIVTARIAENAGINEFHANLAPEQKLKFLENLKLNTVGKIAMIGDGVNDAATLAMADVSFAMGKTGADSAIEAADVTIATDRLEKIPQIISLARKTDKIISQNFIIWGATNSLGLVLVFTGVLDPSRAAFFNFITDFFPILNSFRAARD